MINVAAQNAFSLESQIDILRLRQNWLEKLGLDLIIENEKVRHDRVLNEKWDISLLPYFIAVYS